MRWIRPLLIALLALTVVLPSTPQPGRAQAGVGWSGEVMPAGMSKEQEEGLYRWDKDGMIMVYVEAGTFRMGGDRYEDEAPIHEVEFSRGFYIDRTPITWQAYFLYCDETGTPRPMEPLFEWSRNMPVVNVSWMNATAYCEWAGKQLPTEAQWEYAARGPDSHEYPWGNQAPEDSLGNFNLVGTTPVGSFPDGMSAFGCLDMAGNVWEWVFDWYAEDYYRQFANQTAVDPRGPESGTMRVLKGGSYRNPGLLARPAMRVMDIPVSVGENRGFRTIVPAVE